LSNKNYSIILKIKNHDRPIAEMFYCILNWAALGAGIGYYMPQIKAVTNTQKNKRKVGDASHDL